MDSEHMWKATAIVLCAAVPAGFYVLGDLTDAFPGVLTIEPEETEPAAGPPAQAESWDRAPGEVPTGAVATSPDLAEQTDLQARMDGHADLPVVADGLAFSVVDAGTNEVLAERDAGTARTPASTLKLLTAAAVLRQYEGDEVLATRASVEDGVVTLQGGGDMTLSEEDLRELAADTAALAREQDTEEVSLVLDTSAFGGGENPAWGNNGTAGGWVAPTAALAVEEGCWTRTSTAPNRATRPVTPPSCSPSCWPRRGWKSAARSPLVRRPTPLRSRRSSPRRWPSWSATPC